LGGTGVLPSLMHTHGEIELRSRLSPVTPSVTNGIGRANSQGCISVRGFGEIARDAFVG